MINLKTDDNGQVLVGELDGSTPDSLKLTPRQDALLRRVRDGDLFGFYELSDNERFSMNLLVAWGLVTGGIHYLLTETGEAAISVG